MRSFFQHWQSRSGYHTLLFVSHRNEKALHYYEKNVVQIERLYCKIDSLASNKQFAHCYLYWPIQSFCEPSMSVIL